MDVATPILTSKAPDSRNDLEMSGSIHLILLHPGHATSDICCSVIHTTFQAIHMGIYNSTYTTLSYVW
ncbi:uncharacterized protein Bfra_012250 [Botrytis fragariae]|uniref:Uncharacterized protein n=1 Tax=Botrytis fragariae TaxID=1964551 RepID=A0A8H6AJV8_9HELO|nr:uncharacterized protein Bfra_012250 [Botrytis fragariae]KAF5868603.1 hypothetical protein Bfra_012250 [Botrytis fragariae]